MNQITNRFSVIIPTYTGIETIHQCLKSILTQKIHELQLETIVVIDGPNKELKKIIQTYTKQFQQNGYKLKIHQFSVNKGRFFARLKGAELATYQQLLFVDDRVILPNNYLNTILNTKKMTLMPNVIENTANNYISATLYLIRKKIYKNKWGLKAKSQNLTLENFEYTPKGTTSLWIEKAVFLKSCERLLKYSIDHNVSDDTKLLKEVLLAKKIIHKPANLYIYYQPRDSAMDEISHIYQRGPKFIDYYFKPKTKYFKHLIILLFILSTIPFFLIIYSSAYLYILVAFLLIVIFGTLLLTQQLNQFPLVLVGLAVLFFVFIAGLVKGIAIKMLKSLHTRGKK